MDGLRYIFNEIEARRYLLHAFIKGMQTPEEFCVGVPDFGMDGHLTFRANTKDPPYRNLTTKDFSRLHQKQFMDVRKWSRLTIPLTPDQFPTGYEMKEVLEYEFGGGYCQANIVMSLQSARLHHPDRQLYVYLADRRSPRQGIRYVVNGGEWTYPKGFEVEDKELENLLVQSNPYAQWEKDKKAVRSKSNPAETAAECAGLALVDEGKGVYTAPFILIDEKTPPARIWTQLLVHAWGNGYFDNQMAQREAWEELIRYWLPDARLSKGASDIPSAEVGQVMGGMMQHFKKHPLVPYDPGSSGAYIKKLLKGYLKKVRNESIGSTKYLGRNIDPGKQGKGLRVVSLRCPLGSVFNVAQETGVREWTVYRLIRQGKIKSTRNEEGFICLDGEAIAEVKQVAERNRRRKFIYEIALEKGKSQAATKKWLQRHRNLSQEQMLTTICHWLDIQTDLR